MEAAFCEHLDRLQPKPGDVRLLRKIVRDGWNEKQAGSLAEQRALEQEVAGLEKQEQRLVDLVLSGTLDEEACKERAGKISA